ncbi:response regulator transcription factor [Gordonia sp. VNK21]|uniref:response regulator transcription factor n=1 Tax=Gordonia sp. VNK21 TaxID=3382483 RepID=UPI0038D45EC0
MRILLADDDEKIAETVRRILVSEGWNVDVVHDGISALDRLAGHTYDVIVLDIMMPGRNGYEVVRDLRRLQVWTPVLMLTAKDGEYDQAEALDFGADDYLTKPFSFVVLLARLRALARRGAPERPAALTAGDLTVDPAAHLARRGDTVLDLTPREFAVLEYLVRNKGLALTRATIVDAVWEDGFSGSDKIVEVYVSYLRQRVDVPFGRQAIQTVRGVGYRLDPDGG